MIKRRIALALIGLIILAGVAKAQQGAFPNYPIVGGAAYCSSSVNSVCVNTVPAGPTVLTGNEQIPANTELPNGRTPQNVLITPAALGALPVTIVTVTTSVPTPISAADTSGGVIYTLSAGSITSANITLPANPIDQQRYIVNANRNITTLSVSAGSGEVMATNTAPTVLSVSTTGSPQGYVFRFNLGDSTWYREQ